MLKARKMFTSAMAILLFVSMVGFVGCSGVSEEEMASLNAMRTEVKALEKEVNSLKSERTKLEREIAEHNAKLEKIAKEKAQVEANLAKIKY
jgi:septal ring factor EnvC (AmiA/AmiB activator)